MHYDCFSETMECQIFKIMAALMKPWNVKFYGLRLFQLNHNMSNFMNYCCLNETVKCKNL